MTFGYLLFGLPRKYFQSSFLKFPNLVVSPFVMLKKEAALISAKNIDNFVKSLKIWYNSRPKN